MEEQVIYITNKITSFKSQWNVICTPIPYDNGYIIPLGWESELQAREIEFTYVDYIPPQLEELL